MKKVLVSSALSALLVLPAAALEVYNSDGAKLDVYGSIRGYVGIGENAQVGMGPAGFLFGVQGNSHIGFNVVADKFKAKVEFGAIENGQMENAGGIVAPLRYLWGSYDTGLGTILIGKANTPTTDIFSTGVLNTDTALNGFGGLSTATRRLQAQYNVAGLSLALISDYIAELGVVSPQPNANSSSTMPRIALSYTIYNGSNPLFQIAGTYKRFTGESVGNPTTTNGAVTSSDPLDAWHISVGTKPTFGNSFVSLFGFYGKNQDAYGETNTFYNSGAWNHGIVGGLATTGTGRNIKRAGGKAELGIGLSKDATFTIGAGYQETFGEIRGKYKSVGVFAQVPYKVNANFTLTPVVGWFQTSGVNGATITNAVKNKVTSVVAAGRVMWSF
ncbi:hypothetical protein [Helicobacter japonicus]|uniref:hypothetical protein n=1 Tax=Helicobacter japonicus TaxID=425400 RepID=UPI0026EF2923|nr:hypothetical protein [Helicobacter japonicus]